MTSTPRALASTMALAIGADVNEYAWSWMDFLALPISATSASVQPPCGEKKTEMPSCEAAGCVCFGSAACSRISPHIASPMINVHAQVFRFMGRILPDQRCRYDAGMGNGQAGHNEGRLADLTVVPSGQAAGREKTQ